MCDTYAAASAVDPPDPEPRYAPNHPHPVPARPACHRRSSPSDRLRALCWRVSCPRRGHALRPGECPRWRQRHQLGDGVQQHQDGGHRRELEPGHQEDLGCEGDLLPRYDSVHAEEQPCDLRRVCGHGDAVRAARHHAQRDDPDRTGNERHHRRRNDERNGGRRRVHHPRWLRIPGQRRRGAQRQRDLPKLPLHQQHRGGERRRVVRRDGNAPVHHLRVHRQRV